MRSTQSEEGTREEALDPVGGGGDRLRRVPHDGRRGLHRLLELSEAVPQAGVVSTRRGSLFVHRHKPEGTLPLVALHGFTLHGGMFEELAGAMGRCITAPDLPGHGKSRIAPITIEAAVEAVAEWLENAGRPVDLLGYSQGGRIALHLALDHPHLVASLIAISASPGVSDLVEREQRRRRDLATADRLERIGLSRFLDAWVAQDVVGTATVDEPRRRADRALREQNTAPGLAEALRGMGQGVQQDLMPALAGLEMDSLFMAGERDTRYVVFARAMAEQTNGQAVIVEGGSHNLILENPLEVAATVMEFLDRTDSTRLSPPPGR